MAITAAERHEIAELLVLMFNAAPGATYLSQIVSVYESLGHNLKSLAEALGNHPGYTATHPNFWTGDEFATNLLTPLNLSGDFQARTAVVNAFNSGVSMADITYSAYVFLNDVTANPAEYAPQYLVAAKIMNNKADVALYYSVTKGLSAANLADLQDVLTGVTDNPASVTTAETAIDNANDPQTLVVTANSPSVTEGDAGTKVLTFTVTLLDGHGAATTTSTTINYATTSTGATATAGDDYLAAAGTVTFAPGQTQATVSITVLGDTTNEVDEKVKLVLSGSGIAAYTATGTIVNDDPVPVPPQSFTVSADAPQITEGDTGSKVLTFTVTLLDQNGAAPTSSTTVNYSTTLNFSPNPATPGDDFVSTAGTITFAPGQSVATVSVTVLGDTAFEGNETVKLLLTGSSIPVSFTATGTIIDDDPVPQQFLTPNADVIVGLDLGETINGTQDTFTLNDNIDGNGGSDTLKLVYDSVISVNPDAIVRPFVTVTDVEHVQIYTDLSLGSNTSDDRYDMSAPVTDGGFGWTGVETIEIYAAGGADVHLKSAASEKITVGTADDVTISDDTVAAIEVTDARGLVWVTASDAATVHVAKAGGYVYVNTNSADIAIDNAGGSDVAIFNGNGTISALNGEDVLIFASDSTTMTVTATSDVEIHVDDIGTLSVTTAGGNTDGGVLITTGDITTGTVSATSKEDIAITADQVTTLHVTGTGVTTGHGSQTVNVEHATNLDVHAVHSNFPSAGTHSVNVAVTNLDGWDGPLGSGPWGFDATVMISGEDNVSVDGGKVDSITVTGALDTNIDAGVIGSVTLGVLRSTGVKTVEITTYSDGDLSLTLAGAHIDALTLNGTTTDMSDVALDVTASSYAVLTGASDVVRFALTGAGDLVFNTTAVDGTLHEINGATYTGSLTLDAGADDGDLSVTTGSGNDIINIYGDMSNASDVIVDAGAGNNVIDVDSYGLTNVTVGAGNDDVTVNFDTLAVAGSGVALGAGTNSLTLRSYDVVTDEDLDAFDIAALPLSGNLMSLTFAASVELSQGSSSTLDVGGLTGPISYVGFGDVNVFSDSGEASLTIAGTGTTLKVQSSDDFGSDSGNGMIDFEAVGVTNLTLAISDDMNVMLMGDSVAQLGVNVGGSGDLVLDGDSDGNGTPDQLQGLLLVDMNVGDNADLTLANLRSAPSIDLLAGEDATVDISYSTLGAVNVDFGGFSNWHAEFDINDTSDSTVTVGNIDINDNAVTVLDGDNGSTVTIEVSDNDFSTVLVGTVTATADGDVDMSVYSNNHANVTLGTLNLTSRFNDVTLTISDNTDNEVGPDAIVKLGDVNLSGQDYAELKIVKNVDSAVTLGNVSLDSSYASQWLQITGNDESTIKLGTVDMTSGYGADTVQLVISDNDGAQITVGAVNIETSTSDVVDVAIFNMDATEVNIASLTINADSDVTLMISETTDSTVDIGDVKITSYNGTVLLQLSDNTGVGSISLGNVTIDTLNSFSDDASSDGDVIVNSSDGNNFGADITFGKFDISAAGDVTFHVSGENNGGGVTTVGSIDIIAGRSVTLNLDNVSDGGDVMVDAGGMATVNIHSLFGGGLKALTVTAGSDATVDVSDVDSVDTVTVTAGRYSDATVTLENVTNLTSLTVSASDATITLINVNSDSAFTLDISGVHSDATVDATMADFNSTGKFVNVLIGHGDVDYSNDTMTGSGTNDESRERFEFGFGTGTDDVGDVVIDNFRPGATAAVDGVWTDRIDFSHLDGVNSLEDLTFAIVGNDVIIDFVDTAYGSITLTGVGDPLVYPNATDLVIASITF